MDITKKAVISHKTHNDVIVSDTITVKPDGTIDPFDLTVKKKVDDNIDVSLEATKDSATITANIKI